MCIRQKRIESILDTLDFHVTMQYIVYQFSVGNLDNNRKTIINGNNELEFHVSPFYRAHSGFGNA